MTAEMLIIRAQETIRMIESEEQELDRLTADIEARKAALVQMKEQAELFERVRQFIQQVTTVTRGGITDGLERIVTTCLHIAFGEEYSFAIKVETKQNLPAVDFYIDRVTSEGVFRKKIKGDVAAGIGGGILDTICIGLAFGILQVIPDAPDGPIFFDEPARMTDKERAPQIIALVKQMSELLGRQVILTTHHDHEDVITIADQAYLLRNSNNTTEVSPP